MPGDRHDQGGCGKVRGALPMTRILAWWAFCLSRSALARRVRMRVEQEEDRYSLCRMREAICGIPVAKLHACVRKMEHRQ